MVDMGALACDDIGRIAMSKKNYRHIWNFLSHWKKPSVSDDWICSLNLMLWCCNTHPVAKQESFHKSQGQLQQQLTMLLPSLSFHSLSLWPLSKPCDFHEEVIIASFCAYLPREVIIDFCHIVELWLFMFSTGKDDIINGFLCDRKVGVCLLHFQLTTYLNVFAFVPLYLLYSPPLWVLSVPTDIDIPWRSGVMWLEKDTKPGRRYRWKFALTVPRLYSFFFATTKRIRTNSGISINKKKQIEPL